MDQMTFGQRLRLKRKEMNLSQEALAAALGKQTRQTISNYELDKQQPNVGQAKTLADLLGTTVGYLVDGDPAREGFVLVSKQEWNARNESLIDCQRKLLSYMNIDLAR